MAKERRLGPPYQKAPITEAVIEIRVALPSDVTLATLADIHTALRDAYPTRRNRVQVEGQVGVGSSVSAQVRQRQVGYQFVSADEVQIVQCSLDGFSLSRLAPYQGWAPFRDEARRLWDAYRAATRPTAITRVGVRYINRLDLPLPFADFREYLRTVPEVAPGLPQELSAYFMRLEIPHDYAQALLVIHQALAPPELPNAISVILDLDAIRQVDLPADESGLWELIEMLRRIKNNAFEECITDKTREVIS